MLHEGSVALHGGSPVLRGELPPIESWEELFFYACYHSLMVSVLLLSFC